MASATASRASTRSRIIVAAIDRFRDRGIQATSLDEIATSAGVHRATLHRLFPGGREELVSEVIVDFGTETVKERLRSARIVDTSAHDGLAEILFAVITAGRSDPMLNEALTTQAGSFVFDRDRLAPVVTEAISWWQSIADSRASDGLRWVRIDGRLVDLYTRIVVSLVREPGALATDRELRAYIEDLVVPIALGQWPEATTT